MCGTPCGITNPGKTKKKSPTPSKIGECVVCVGMDGDHTHKEVWHCDLCNEWFCSKCQKRLVGRGWLALQKMFKPA